MEIPSSVEEDESIRSGKMEKFTRSSLVYLRIIVFCCLCDYNEL